MKQSRDFKFLRTVFCLFFFSQNHGRNERIEKNEVILYLSLFLGLTELLVSRL